MSFSGFPGSLVGGDAGPRGAAVGTPPGRATGGGAASDGGRDAPFAAPSGPSAAAAVAVTSRGGLIGPGALAAAPATLGELTQYYDPPPGFDELLEELGADLDVALDVFMAVPEADIVAALAGLEVAGARLSSIAKARLIVLLRSLFVACGRVAPALGTVPTTAPAAARATASATDPGPVPEAAGRQLDAPGATVNLSQVVDQAVKGTTRRLTLTELKDARVHYEAVTGAPPPERALPTSEQLAGLRAILEQDLPPFVDFAVWSPNGPRAAKFQRTEASVLIGGVFVTKTLDAPNSFTAWEDSWALFANAMVSLNAARPGSLGCYLDGIKMLLRHFPSKWSSIVTTDLLVRSERWMRIREDLERAPYPLGYDARAPWDYIIGASAYGRDGPLTRWWQDEVVLPMSLSGGRPPFHDGLPGQASSSSSSRGPPPPPRSGAATPRAKSGRTSKLQEAHARQVCNSYNSGVGTCASGGPKCKFNRRHECAICEEPHQAYKVHPDKYVPPAPAKGKGGAGKGDKRKH